MPDTFVKIASVIVGSGGASTIAFSSIPSTYTDLCLKFSNRTTDTGVGNGFNLTLNGSSSSFTWRAVYGDGAAASSISASNNGMIWVDGTSETANTFANVEVYFPNYAGSNNKSFSNDAVMENNATGAYAGLQAGLWSNTAAITSMTLTPQLGNWAQYSSAVLYGIKNS